MGWTDDRIATLKKLWLNGLSASQIAKQLGGVTRNAVVGKVHRLGLSGQSGGSGGFSRAVASAPKRVAAPKAAAPSAPKAVAPPTEPAMTSVAGTGDRPLHRHEFDFRGLGAVLSTGPKPPSLPVERVEAPGAATVLTLSAHMCRWPIGDPFSDGFSFCGRRKGNGGPYCAEHAQVAYQQPQEGKRKTSASELARSLRRYI